MVFRRDANCKQRVKGITDVVSSAEGDPRKRCPGPGRAGKYRTAERPAAGLPQRASQCWRVHPRWRIGNIEAKAGGQPSLDSHPRVSSHERKFLDQRRAHLLDHVITEVRELRLTLVREFVQRYDVLACIVFTSPPRPHLPDPQRPARDRRPGPRTVGRLVRPLRSVALARAAGGPSNRALLRPGVAV